METNLPFDVIPGLIFNPLLDDVLQLPGDLLRDDRRVTNPALVVKVLGQQRVLRPEVMFKYFSIYLF